MRTLAVALPVACLLCGVLGTPAVASCMRNMARKIFRVTLTLTLGLPGVNALLHPSTTD